MHGEWEFFIQGILISLLGGILSCLRRLKQRMVSSTEMSLEISPCSPQGAAHTTALFGVVITFGVEHRFQLSTERSSFEGLSREIASKSFIFQMLPNFLKAFLSIDETFDNRMQRAFN